MERKENRLPIFTERFRSLQGDRTNTEFADFLGLSRQTVGFYCNGDRLPDVVTLKQIAGKCGVTTDWLLGHNTPLTEADVCIACAVTGLSREAILKLKNLPDNSSYDDGALHHFSQNVEEENAEGEIHRCLGELLCSPTFIELIAQICRYKDSCEASELLLDAGLSADTCAVAEQINKIVLCLLVLEMKPFCITSYSAMTVSPLIYYPTTHMEAFFLRLIYMNTEPTENFLIC